MSRILVTGATGFIGFHLSKRLLKEGYEVFGLIRNPQKDLPHGVKPLWGDIIKGNLPELKGFDYVFHLAALTKAVREKDYFLVNEKGTELLIKRLLEDGFSGKLIFLSSLSAQGPTIKNRPLREDDPPHPVSPYGLSKLKAEEKLQRCSSLFRVIILRPSVVYGPKDEYMLHFFKLIQRRFLPLLRDEQWLSLCYVEDVVEALLLCLQKEVKSGEVFLISDGQTYSLHQLADVVASILKVNYLKIRVPPVIAKSIALLCEMVGRLKGKGMPFNLNKLSESLQEAWLCDISKAKKVLGFVPKYNLKEGLLLTINWYKAQGLL